jgi:hypothetical protein
VFTLTLVLIGWTLGILQPLLYEEALLFVILCVGATLAHLFKVEVPPRQTYFVGMIPFFAAVLLVQPFAFVLVVAVAHVIELIKERWVKSTLLRNWYLQPFNMAAHSSGSVRVGDRALPASSTSSPQPRIRWPWLHWRRAHTC